MGRGAIFLTAAIIGAAIYVHLSLKGLNKPFDDDPDWDEPGYLLRGGNVGHLFDRLDRLNEESRLADKSRVSVGTAADREIINRLFPSPKPVHLNAADMMEDDGFLTIIPAFHSTSLTTEGP